MDEEHPVVENPPERVDGCWLVLDYPGNPTIRLDARLVDRIFVDDGHLIVNVDDVAIGVTISGGEHVARMVAEKLRPFTRTAPITLPEVYDDARRRLAAACQGGDHSSPALLFGNDVVRASNELLYVGSTAFWLSDVEDYALTARELPLPNGKLQAALARLIIADRQRVDDQLQLSKRIAEYEAYASTP